MSVFCPKCQSKTYNEWKCDICQYQIKEEAKIKRQQIKFNFNPIIVIPLIIISIGISYLAYDKYQERKLVRKFIGTNDPDEMIKNLNKMTNKSNEMLKKQMEMSKKQMENLQFKINDISH